MKRHRRNNNYTFITVHQVLHTIDAADRIHAILIYSTLTGEK